MFFKISFVYIIYYIITLLLLSLCFQIVKVKTQYISPSYRKLHGATLVGNKLYISGGITEFDDPKNENKSPDDNFFYLDLSNPFDTSKLTWKAVPNNVENFPIESLSSEFTGGMAVGIGGVNKDMIYFINNENDINLPPVLSFNTQSSLWETPKISGVRPIGRNQMKVIDYNHKLYFLSNNGMYIFDTINLNCEVKTDSPIFRLGYGATLLPNGIIVYMGGNDNNDLLTNFNEVYLYDTNNNKWETKVTTGTIPPSDYGMTSVLGLNGNRIIVFGGMINNNLQVLDITNNYTWYVPKVGGKAPVYKRGEHTATVVENYMLITFGSNGNGPDENFKYRSSGESDVLLLDISDDSEYAWTTTFDIIMGEPRYSYSLPQKIGIIVGPIIGAVLLVVILSRCFHVRRQKNKKLISPSDKDNINMISD